MSLLRKPVIWGTAAVLAIILGAGLYWFEPWKLATDREVNDALATIPPAPSAQNQPAQSQPAQDQPAQPAVIRQGDFISHEHDTTGTARIVRHPDGTQVLELVGLDTSDGPDLRVWLSDQEVRTGTAGWRVFDDGDHVELGELKGNRGDQTYPIPAGTDLDRLQSISIWCIRFSVSFGAATLKTV